MGSYKWVISDPLIWSATIVTLLITPLITIHEPPSISPKPDTSQAPCRALSEAPDMKPRVRFRVRV